MRVALVRRSKCVANSDASRLMQPIETPIDRNDSPRGQRSHNSVLSAVLKPRRYLCFICRHAIFAFKIKCCVDRLRPYPEIGHSIVPGFDLNRFLRRIIGLNKKRFDLSNNFDSFIKFVRIGLNVGLHPASEIGVMRQFQRQRNVLACIRCD